MRDDLFFIPILSDAFRCPDPEAGIRRAIEQIIERRDDPRYRVGFRQFLRFLDAASTIDDFEQEALTRAALRILLAQIEKDVTAPELGHGEAVTQTGKYAACAQAVRAMRDLATRSELLMLQVERDGESIASLPLPQAGPAVIRKIRPGTYTFTLDNGRLLWTGELGPSELLWRRAFPGRPLRLAADSALPSIESTRKIPLLVGLLTAVVYPGVEAGTIRVVSGDTVA